VEVSTTRQREVGHQDTRIDVQAIGDLDNCLQAQASLSAFDLAKLRPVDAATIGRCFLTEPKFVPTVTHTFAEDARRFVEARLGSFVGHRSPIT
jgi:hypothetical protein